MTELRSILSSFEKDVLLVTHSRDEAYDLCGLLALMDSGRITGIGPTKEIFNDPGTRTGAITYGMQKHRICPRCGLPVRGDPGMGRSDAYRPGY